MYLYINREVGRKKCVKSRLWLRFKKKNPPKTNWSEQVFSIYHYLLMNIKTWEKLWSYFVHPIIYEVNPHPQHFCTDYQRLDLSSFGNKCHIFAIRWPLISWFIESKYSAKDLCSSTGFWNFFRNGLKKIYRSMDITYLIVFLSQILSTVKNENNVIYINFLFTLQILFPTGQKYKTILKNEEKDIVTIFKLWKSDIWKIRLIDI